MRILITGAGVMGSVFGCFLRKMGLDFWVRSNLDLNFHLL